MDHRNAKPEHKDSIMVGGLELSLNPATMTVTAESQAGSTWRQQGVDTVLLFGILAALTDRKPK